MKRGNPLFVDSTKFQGDQILTKLQARAPYAIDGSQFIAEVQRSRGTSETSRIPLIFDDEDGLWRGQIYLEHLEPIQVRLILKTPTETAAERADEPAAEPAAEPTDAPEVPGPFIEAMGTHIVDLYWDRAPHSPPLEIG